MPLERIDGELCRQNISLFSNASKNHIIAIEHLLSIGATGSERIREREWVSTLLVKEVLAVAGPGGAAWAAINDSRHEEILLQLRQSLAEGKQRSIALLYGAAHIAALEPRILSDLGFTLESTSWHDALVVELKSDSADACLRRGHLWADEGNFEAAKSDYSRALELAPRTWPSRPRVEQMLRDIDSRR